MRHFHWLSILFFLLYLQFTATTAAASDLCQNTWQSGAQTEGGEPVIPSSIAEAGELMRQHRSELESAGVLPEHLPNISLAKANRTKASVVLVHGLKDSPKVLKSLVKLYNAIGVNVVTVLLDGHGTKPEDLAHASLDKWRTNVLAAKAIAQKLGEHVLCAGHSLGGGVCLDMGDRFDGRMLHAPLISMTRASKRMGKNSYANWDGTSAAWVEVKPDFNRDFDDYGYARTHMNGYHMVVEMEKRLAHLLADSTLATPTGIIYANRDSFVSADAIESFIAAQSINAAHVHMLESRDHREPANPNAAAAASIQEIMTTIIDAL